MDPKKLRDVARHVFGQLSGAVVTTMIVLGGRLGLYRAMRGAGPMSAADLARKTGLDERWLLEWLRNQGAARILAIHGEDRFELEEETACILADEDHPAFGMGFFEQLPAFVAVLEKLPEAFRSGLGLPYDALGPEGAAGVERGLAPWFRAFLVPVVLPKLEGVVDKLRAGASVADVGCGAGAALLEMAKAFPKSEFHGYEISKHALARAERNKLAADVRNATFHDASGDRLPTDASFDLVTAFDCIHDMTRPAEVIAAIRRSLKPDGTWLVVDIKGKPTFAENARDNPMAAMMYGFSVLACMSSALSEPGGAGLGTLGFHEDVAQQMATRAGFTRFRRLDVEHPMNAFYEARP
jgi:SAM-dependent methyltransferase